MIWDVERVLERIETILTTQPNTCELEYLIELKAELEQVLHELEKTCGTCKVFCGNEHCITKQTKDEK